MICRRNRTNKVLWTVLFLFLLSFFGVSRVSAHKVSVFAWVEEDTVYVESKFSGGRRPVESPVVVYDNMGNKLLEGRTDQNGAFQFKVPQKTELKVVLEAGMGHRAEWVIPEEELRHLDQEADPGHPADAVALTAEAPDTLLKTGTSVSGPSVICLSEKEMQAAVDHALDQRLRPIKAMLADMQDKGPTVHDIFCGLGYILGLVGLVAYMRSRKESSS